MAETKYGVLEDVTFAYAKLAVPVKKYQSEDTLYEVDCIVTKAQAKAWNKEFPKQKAKELDADDFVEKYKMEAPYEGDEIYVIKLRKPASKDGEIYDEKFRPKVLLDTADGERVDITTSRLISNGSSGKVSYRITENDFGRFGQLNNILMDEDGFLEYKSSGGSAAGSEFDGKGATKAEAPSEAATKPREPKEEAPARGKADTKPAGKTAKPKKAPADDEDDDIPF